MRPVVYLSGPISNGGELSLVDRHEHIRYATEVALSLMQEGFSVICPHWSCLGEEHARRHISHPEWIENDLPIIAKCDAIYRLPGESVGADQEVDFAVRRGILVFWDRDTLRSLL